jgi:hypothetical protein
MPARSIAAHSMLLAATMILAASSLSADEKANPFLGNWALTIPGGGAGWLGVRDDGGKLLASILWGGGSVLPVDDVKMDGNKLIVTRGTPGDVITATVDGDNLSLTVVTRQPDGSETAPASFTGKQIPPLPQPPDLSKVNFGEPITLFNGKNLDGWRLVNPNSINGWRAHDGLLVNDPVQEPGKPHKNYGNLRTDREFEDFNLTLETKVPKDGNSGIYLRGIYEVQVFDSYGRPVDRHNMGAIYSRITPSEAAERPAGQWQTFDVTLVDRHVTVILNGKKIIDNQPLLGCTGGALWSDEFRPGPIYLQGDHTGVTYRNIVLRPVVR